MRVVREVVRPRDMNPLACPCDLQPCLSAPVTSAALMTCLICSATPTNFAVHLWRVFALREPNALKLGL